jgi:DAK2 domain fusion protein YloV
MAVHERIDGQVFAQMIRAGHRRLRAMVEAVNALNVFPVPDGDTGTNMELSLAAGVAKLNEQTDGDLAGAAQALAVGLLMGARGNSGVILSQLFRGFQKVARRVDALDTAAFAQALQEGVQIAYRAVAKPVEGTMLTVAREAAAAGVREARRRSDLAAWMAAVVEAAKASLQRTPELLPVLKQAGVVDSGGQGLVYIYEGFLEYLEGRAEAMDEPAGSPAHDALVFDYAAAQIDHEGEYGYCTEVLIELQERSADDAQQALREILEQYGDSLLVVGSDSLLKVHVHTLHPGRVLEDALQFGPLLKVKVDNMTRQHEAIRDQHAARSEPEPDAERLTPADAAAADGPVNVEVTGSASSAAQRRCAVVAVASGSGLEEILRSLGVDVIVTGGQTMNPSTQEIAAAAQAVQADAVLVLPNNRNIILAAQQAQQVVGDRMRVVPTVSIPQAIAALMAYRPDADVADNVARMEEAIQAVRWGQVVRAARDSVYQGRSIVAGDYLGFAGTDLVEVGAHRIDVLVAAAARVHAGDGELLTVLYGGDVSDAELEAVKKRVEAELGVEVESHFGGQPVYDYIFSVE